MKPVIGITEKEYYKAEQIFKSHPDFDCVPVDFNEMVIAKMLKEKSAFGVILGVEPYKDQLYSVLPKGGIIARFGVGHDGVDKDRATQEDLLVTNTPGVLDDSVAEHAMMLMGCFARNISSHDRDMKDNKWHPVIGNELKDKTLLVLGCGPIGRKTAKIASFGFGMNVIGYDIAELDKEQLKKDYGFNNLTSNLDDVIGKVDYLSIHIPSMPATKHFINEYFLSKVKSSCVIINTARGPVVDEVALYDALKDNKIAGSAIDVFENEPFEPLNPEKDLRTLENVILTPHVGSSTIEACQRMAESCLRNIKAAYGKKYEQLDILNPEVIERLR